MKVVLLARVAGLGDAGEVVEATEGYARNFLFPNALAAIATSSGAHAAREKKDRAAHLQEAELEKMQRLAELLEGKIVTLRVPAGPQGKLHGAVTANDVLQEIQRSLQVTLPRSSVRLPNPLQNPGEQKITIDLPHGLEAHLTVMVEGMTPPRAEEA